MWKFKYIFILININIILIETKTVFYTISPPPLIDRSDDFPTEKLQITTKTYELQVPGSDPIKIIEADEPLWKQQPISISTEPFNKDDRTVFKNRSINSQRKFKFSNRIQNLFTTTQQTKTTLNEPFISHNNNKCYGIACQNYDSEKKKDYTATDLNKFLSEYTKRVNPDFPFNQDPSSESVVMEKVDLIESPTKNDDINEKSKLIIDDSDVIEEKHNKSPYDDRNGWVTLEAVPWSKSKVSKWESNTKPISSASPPQWPDIHWQSSSNHRPPSIASQYYGDKTNFDPTPLRPSYNNVDDKYYGSNNDKYYGLSNEKYFESNNKQDWASSVPSRPVWDRNTDYGSQSDYPWSLYDNVRRPIVDSQNCTKDHSGEIITDGRPGNFPTHSLGFIPYNDISKRPQALPQQRPTQISYTDFLRPSPNQNRPITYPDVGDGQWVLLSTTKGYQYPKNRQRSLDINPGALKSRKSLRLTVLPPLNGSDVNMTTSHGGLLQVDSTFETVDESRRAFIRKLKSNNTRKHIRVHRTPQNQQVSTSGPDTTAVLAAVGAGMVPATMAMVMPLVLGRKRRSIINTNGNNQDNSVMLQKLEFNVTHLPNYNRPEPLSRLQQ